MESIGKILKKEIREKIDKDIKKSIENLRMLCEAYKRESDEFDKECYEIKEKLKDILADIPCASAKDEDI
jgi:chaperonin cofactor prefoldin